MPRMIGSHTAVNLASQISSLVHHFHLQTNFGHAITDNASENRACLNLLAEELAFDAGKRHVLCVGHIINLVAHKVLFGSDVESFVQELESNATAESVELASWRRKGPIGKLHNLIKYILHSTERQDAFLSMQTLPTEPSLTHPRRSQQPLHLIRDNLTRWNSWYDAAVRAIELRDAIDEFTEYELTDYRQKAARYERRTHGQVAIQKNPPKASTLFHDKLDTDD